jgi:chromosome segregation ATPase
MVSRYVDGDAATGLLERRWFAAFKAASSVRAECESLLESMARAEDAWSRARERLAEIEALRDALGEQLDALNERDWQPPTDETHLVMSAA